MAQGTPGLKFEMPAWALEVMAEPEEPVATTAPKATDLRGAPAWPLLLEAAVVNTFLPEQLHPQLEEERAAAEAELLRFCEPTVEPGGVKWRLAAGARRDLLQAALGAPELEEAIRRTESLFVDEISRALRTRLGGVSVVLESLTLAQIEALGLVSTWLEGLPDLPALPQEEFDREIDRRRLLAQFGRMIGTDAQMGTDCFFGRVAELDRLRNYVGEVAAETLWGKVSAAAGAVSQKFSSRTPLSLWGTGGVGKTSLMAKFMLEHAQAAEDRFPFAYLDFDRPTITARNPAELLAEMCLQVGAQFAELRAPMKLLRGELRSLADRTGERQISPGHSALAGFAADFRRLVDGYLERNRKLFRHHYAFLLVFDTFEVVQYAPEAVTLLEKFLADFLRVPGTSLSPSPSLDSWPRLRLVISGRTRVERFLGQVEEIPLAALDRPASIALLTALVSAPDAPLPPAQAEKLVDAVARLTGGEEARGARPLSLRLVAEDLRKAAPADRDRAVTDLIAELEAEGAGSAASRLIDGLLTRRVLGHIGDPRVARLADPGLIVRYISPATIRDVLARGTPGPDAVDPDPLDFEPWQLPPGEEDFIFRAMAQENSLVECDGDHLRFRQDVRSDVLQLIRHRRPALFARMHALAQAWFLEAMRRDPVRAHAYAGEAIYHGLWLKKPLEEIEAIGADYPGYDARLAADEFPPDSVAYAYIRAKDGHMLRSDQLEGLPSSVRLRWIDRCSSDLLAQPSPEASLAALLAAAGGNSALLDAKPAAAAVAARLFYRTGRWEEAAQLASRVIAAGQCGGEPEAEISLVRTGLSIGAKSGAHPGYELVDAAMRADKVEPDLRVDLLVKLALIEGEHREYAREQLRNDFTRVSMVALGRQPRLLRLLLILLPEFRASLVPLFLETLDQLPRNAEVISAVLSLMDKTGGIPEPVRPLNSPARMLETDPAAVYDSLDAAWHNVRRERKFDAIAQASLGEAETVAFHAHSDWLGVLGQALARVAREDPDWVAGCASELSPSARNQVRINPSADGLALFDAIVADGALLSWARAVEQPNQTPGRPNGVEGLCAALLRWHDRLLGVAGINAI